MTKTLQITKTPTEGTIHTVRAPSMSSVPSSRVRRESHATGPTRRSPPTDNPSFAAVQKVIRVLGYRLDVKAVPYGPSETNEGPPARINA